MVVFQFMVESSFKAKFRTGFVSRFNPMFEWQYGWRSLPGAACRWRGLTMLAVELAWIGGRGCNCLGVASGGCCSACWVLMEMEWLGGPSTTHQQFFAWQRTGLKRSAAEALAARLL